MLTSTLRYCYLLLLVLAGWLPAQAQRLAAGPYHTLSIHADGTLWAWGLNNGDQLGLGSTVTYQETPQQVSTAATWQSVSTGSFHSLAIRQDGSLWAWGSNSFGQLGTGTTPVQSGPQQVGTATTWRSVAAGYLHSLAVRQDGTLWAWGYNGQGELGISIPGGASLQTVPAQVGTATNWASVVAGNSCTLALKTDGTLWAWGANGNGQLGLGTTTQQAAPVQVGTATTWASVSAGAAHTLAVRTDGTLWAWGYNFNGQLGLGTTTDQLAPVQVGTATTWTSVGAGRLHSLARRQDGTLWAWGDNRWGQLGTGATAYTQPTPAQVGTATTWQSLAAGQSHSAALRQDGSLWAWGGNYYGQVGAGPGTPQLLPAQITSAPTWRSVAAGFQGALGIRTDGSLWAWGANYAGQLGNGTTTDQDVPVPVSGGATWQSAATGGGASMAVRQDGTLWTWGDNGFNQLGTGPALTATSVPVQVGTATTWKSVSMGANHAVALRADGSLWAWGSNFYGQLGTGSTADQPTPVRIGTDTWQSVCAGVFATLAIRTDGSLWAWGMNGNGQLGLGTSGNQLTPQRVGTASNWASLALGVFHTLALRTDGTLWSWGSNFYGELGNGNANGGASQLTPAQVGTATTWVSVSTRAYASAAVRQDGSLWVWGMNDYGGLGLGTTARQVAPVRQGTATWQSVGLGTDFGAAIRPDGTLWTWGLNQYGQLGNGLRLSAAPRYVPGGGAVLAATAASAASTWALAPNPAHEQVQLLGLPTGPVAVRLYDAQGRLVRTAAEATVSTVGLAPGLYLLQAVAAGQPAQTRRLIVE